MDMPTQIVSAQDFINDVNPDTYKDGDLSCDFNYQSNTTALFCHISGFHHHMSAIKFSLSIGTSKGSHDIVSGRKLGYVCSDNLDLKHMETYFTTIRAISAGGSTFATSNGITVIDIDTVYMSSMEVAVRTQHLSQ